MRRAYRPGSRGRAAELALLPRDGRERPSDSGKARVIDRLRLACTLSFVGRDRITGVPTPLFLVVGIGAAVFGWEVFRSGPDAFDTPDSDFPSGAIGYLLAVAGVLISVVLAFLGRSSIRRDHVVLQQPLWGGRPRYIARWEDIDGVYVSAGVRGVGELHFSGDMPLARSHAFGFVSLGMAGPLLTAAVALERGLIPDTVRVAVDDDAWLVRPTARRSRRRLEAAVRRRSGNGSIETAGSPRRQGRLECDVCRAPTEPVAAEYRAGATVDGMAGSAEFRLPMRRCPAGHFSGWRSGEDFFIDLVDADTRYDPALIADGVRPTRRLFGSPRCGSCGEKLRLVEAGRSRGTVRLDIRDVTEPAVFDCDLPRAVCERCGARPLGGRKLTNTAADIDGWLFQLIADGMPPERATRVTPRIDDPA